MKKLVLAVVVACAAMVGAKAEWIIDTSAKTATNDKWKITVSEFNNLENMWIQKLEPMDGNDDPTVLDVTELIGIATTNGKTFQSLMSNTSTDTIKGIKKIILPAGQRIYYLRLQSLIGLEEICTDSPTSPHTISVRRFGEHCFGGNNGNDRQGPTGDYVFTNVEQVDQYAFAKCLGFTSIRIEGSFGGFSNGPFYRAMNLKTIELVTTGTITTIGQHFAGSNSDKEYMAVEEFTINGQPFDACGTITKIDNHAFRGASSLKIDGLNLPACTYIGERAFCGCAKLTGGLDAPVVTQIGQYAFDGSSLNGELKLPKVQKMGYGVFRNLAITGTLNLPELTSLDQLVFQNCTGLTGEIVTPKLASMGKGAFQNCTGLSGTLNMPVLTSIGEDGFRGCTGLTGDLKFPEVTSVGHNAFIGSGANGEIDFPKVKTLGNNVFQDLPIKGDVILPECTKMEQRTFQGCSQLTGKLVAPKLQTMSSFDFYRSGISGDVDLPCLTSFGERTFAECPNLTGIISVPLVTFLGNSTFRQTPITGLRVDSLNAGNQGDGISDCDGLTFISLPAMTCVASCMLRYCDNLAIANFPVVTSFYGNEALAQCPNLKYVVFGSEDALAMKGKTFYNSFKNHDGAVVWNTKTVPTFTDTGNYTFESCGTVVNYVRKEAGWAGLNDSSHKAVVEDVDGTLYFRRASGNTSNQEVVRPMDTVIALTLTRNGDSVLETLVPGVDGEAATFTVNAFDIFPTGTSFNEATPDVDGVTAQITNGGQTLVITVPASVQPAPSDSETKEMSLGVAVVAGSQSDCNVSVTIKDEDGNTITTDEFKNITWSSTVTGNYYDEIVDETYYYTRTSSMVVEPDGALVPAFDSLGQLTLGTVGADAEVTIVVNRTERPAQLDHWVLAADKKSMTDNVWTFRCDFTDDSKAVIADACGYIGADGDKAAVDLAKPIMDEEGGVHSPRTLNWKYKINNVEVSSKTVVINGGTATPASLIEKITIPRTGVVEIAQYDNLASLKTFEPFLPDSVTTLGDNAFDACYALEADCLYLRNITTLKSYAFRNCQKVKALLARNLTTFNSEGFRYCYDMAFDASDLRGQVAAVNGNSVFASTKTYGRLDWPDVRDGDFCGQSTVEEIFFRNARASGFPQNAFGSYKALRKVVMPRVLSTVGNDLFDYGYCPSDVYWVGVPTKFTAVNNVYGGHDTANIHTNYFLLSSVDAWNAALAASSSKPTLAYPQEFGASGVWTASGTFTQIIRYYLGMLDHTFLWDADGNLTVKSEVMAVNSDATKFTGKVYSDDATLVKSFDITTSTTLGAFIETPLELPVGTYKVDAVAEDGEHSDHGHNTAVFYNGTPRIEKVRDAVTPKANKPGQLVISREGPANYPLTVKYDFTSAQGAAPGLDFAAITGSVTIPAGQSSAIIDIVPLVNEFTLANNLDLAFTLVPSPHYSTVDAKSVTVSIRKNAGGLLLLVR